MSSPQAEEGAIVNEQQPNQPNKELLNSVDISEKSTHDSVTESQNGDDNSNSDKNNINTGNENQEEPVTEAVENIDEEAVAKGEEKNIDNDVKYEKNDKNNINTGNENQEGPVTNSSNPAVDDVPAAVNVMPVVNSTKDEKPKVSKLEQMKIDREKKKAEAKAKQEGKISKRDKP